MQPQKIRQYSQHHHETLHRTSPEARPPLKPDKGKQREQPQYWERDSMMADSRQQQASELAYRAPSMEMAFYMEPDMPPEPQPASDTYSRTLKFAPPPATPVRDRSDPSLYKLPPTPRPPISAPLQPRLTDLRGHLERDPTYSSPTYTLEISCKLKFEPGNLR